MKRKQHSFQEPHLTPLSKSIHHVMSMSSALNPPRPSLAADMMRSESTPLLSGERRSERDMSYYGSGAGSQIDVATDGGAGGRGQQARASRKRFPLQQVLLLALMRMASPIAYSQIFPYINEMVGELGVTDDPKKVGYYSGIVDSTFSFVQLFTCLKLGMLADSMGRKPILIAGLIGIILCTFGFGLAKTFAITLFIRALGGALSGNAMIINSSIGDITDGTNQEEAYAIIGLAYNVASILGPVVGGTFAKPELSFPDSLGKIAFLRKYPYFLPCAITGSVVIIALWGCIFFYKETSNKRPVLKKEASCYSSSDVNLDVSEASSRTAWKIAREPALYSVLRAFFLMNVIAGAAQVVFTLFAYTPIKDGGLSRTPKEIGFAVAFSGILASAAEMAILPALQRRIGSLVLYKWTMALWPPIFLSFPLINRLAQATLESSSRSTLLASGGVEHSGRPPANIAVWVALAVHLTAQRVATMAYPLNLVLTRNAAPSDEVLGTVFGLSQLVGCVARTGAPVFISSLFAISKEKQILGGNLVWAVMTILSFLGAVATFAIKEHKAEIHSESDDD